MEEEKYGIRRSLSRQSKDKAIARIHVPLENGGSPGKIKIRRSRSLFKNCLQERHEKLNDIGESDESDEDFKDITSESDESISESDGSLSSLENKPTKVNIKRSKTFAHVHKTLSVPTRKGSCRLTENDVFNFRRFNVDDRLSCREKEYDTIYQLLYEKINVGVGGCLFVSGLPGTGKTLTVWSILDALQNTADENVLPNFNRVEINGMQITDIRQLYVEVVLKLTGRKVSTKKGRDTLKTLLFSGRVNSRYSVVLVIDEIDQLCQKKIGARQEVLYQLFDWAQMPGSKLVIIAIANTMDLPERYFQNKVASRIGLSRVTFEPYTHNQLVKIIQLHMGKTDAAKFDSQALLFISMKVASSTGDARKVIDICRRAVELTSGNELITTETIDKVIKEMFSSPFMHAIQNCCSEMEKAFLRAIVTTFKSLGVEEASLMNIMTDFYSIIKTEGFPTISTDNIFRIVHSLSSQGFLSYDSLSNDIRMIIKLNLRANDVLFALEEKYI